jgi:hypothetical protein
MRMLHNKPTALLSIGLGICSANLAFAVPKYETTVLPVDTRMFQDAENKKMLEFLPSLALHQDSVDPNHYYYVPVFRAVANQRSASVLVNRSQISRADSVDRILSTLHGNSANELKQLSDQYLTATQRLATLKASEESFRSTLQFVAADLKKRRDAVIAEANSVAAPIPPSIKKEEIERLTEVLGSAGITEVGDLSTGAESRGAAAGKLNRSNGGLFTANIYAGFYADQVILIKQYHEARAKLNLPDVIISKLPVESITWDSLAETVIHPNGSSSTAGIPMIRNIQGGGNYEGATINMDLTVDGARAFASAPPPIVLPVFAKARSLQQYPPFKAHLSCDFHEGWKVQGRADVRDGLVIYNNDITNNMVAINESSTDKPCTLKFEGGGGSPEREAGYRKSLESVLSRLEDIHLSRSNLALADKRNYFQSVQNDIQANRHSGANDSGGGLFGGFLNFCTGGWGGFAFGLFSHASTFYWHTDIQNVESISKLHFEEDIVDAGNTSVSTDIATNICLAYNPDKNMYLACAREEENVGLPVQDALHATGCGSAPSTEACANDRKVNAPRNPTTGNIAPESL